MNEQATPSLAKPRPDDRASTLLADLLCAAADDTHVALTRRDANRIARRAVDLLDTYGYRITNPSGETA